MSEILKKGETYKSFEVTEVFELSDYHSLAIHLKEKRTGLEILHLLNDDEENLFSFSFRTLNNKANGAAHILEHSVLCGSERFPLKDPFVALSNQSVKTYLNAMTYPDRTVFPASSTVKADYFNLMNVYGDAVFFPLLEPEIFMQEAHRLEVDDSGKPSIQGVVYNEMKGNYSSFDSVASDFCNLGLLSGSVYEKDFGGDPLEIPLLSHEELLAFHRKWYRPDNCFIFLYGNIPTQEQLDFIDSNFLSRLEKKYPEVVSKQSIFSMPDFLKQITSAEVSCPVDFEREAPSGDNENETGASVLVDWRFGKIPDAATYMKYIVLSGVLLNHDGSPLQKALLDSGLGEDVSPFTGFSSFMYDSMFSVGLRGVKAGNERKVQQLVFDTLTEIAKNGVSQKDIDSIMMTLEFSYREIKRSGGPYSLVLMNRAVYGWTYGYDLKSQFRLRSILEKVRKKIEENPDFIKTMIQKCLLENNARNFVVVRPSKSYVENREKIETELIQRLFSETDVESIKKRCDALHEFQSKADDVSCLPHLNPKNFIVDGKPLMSVINTEIQTVKGADGSDVPLFKNVENTNGIVYFDLGFPADVLEPADYPLLPAFCEAVSSCGWKDLDWAKTAELCSMHLGFFVASLLSSDVSNSPKSQEFMEKHYWCGREWVVFKIAMIEEEIPNALNILRDCLQGTDFSNSKRLKDVILEMKNDLDSSIVPNGHTFASLRALCKTTRGCAVDEIWNGLSQLYTIHSLSVGNMNDVAENFRRIFKALKDGGSFIHITGEQSGVDKILDSVASFIAETEITAPKKKNAVNVSDFFKLTNLESDSVQGDDSFEVCQIPGQTGFASECIPAANFATQEHSFENVCTHWLSNTLLWEKIRTIGGAYGAYCSIDSSPGTLSFSTYRDPSPFASCTTFENCLKIASEQDFDKDDVEKAVVGCYSHWLTPLTPRGRGSIGLQRTLYAVSDEERAKNLLWLLNCNVEQLKRCFANLYKTASENAGRFKKRRVVLCGKGIVKSENFTGRFIILPL